MAKTKVLLLGAGFIADIHLESYQRFVPDAEVVGVYTRNGKAAALRTNTALINSLMISKKPLRFRL